MIADAVDRPVHVARALKFPHTCEALALEPAIGVDGYGSVQDASTRCGRANSANVTRKAASRMRDGFNCKIVLLSLRNGEIIRIEIPPSINALRKLR